MDYKKLGERIRKERLESNLTQELLAEAIELSAVYIGQIERAERKLSLETLIKICNYFNIPADSFLRDSLSNQDDISINELITLIRGRSEQEIALITDTIKAILGHIENNSIK